ncbi:MAG: transposase [Parachlamydiales bacterium]
MSQFQELNESQWILIQELMSWSPPKARGKPRTNLKRVWNSILFILTHGCRWED